MGSVMAKKVAETLASIDIVVLHRLRVLAGGMRFIDPTVMGPELADYLRPVGVSNGQVFLRSRGGVGQHFSVNWVATGVSRRPWFGCPCGRNTRRLYCDGDTWACRRCHRLTYASHVAPDKAHWVGVGLLTRILRKLGSDSADPFSPLPARPKGMWRRKYERLAAEFREAQTQLAHSLLGAANWSIAQQNHQIAYGRLTTQRKALRERTLQLAAKQKEALSCRNWSLEALL